MKKSYHSSAEPIADASITRPSDDCCRLAAPAMSADMFRSPSFIGWGNGTSGESEGKAQMAAAGACTPGGEARTFVSLSSIRVNVFAPAATSAKHASTAA